VAMHGASPMDRLDAILGVAIMAFDGGDAGKG